MKVLVVSHNCFSDISNNGKTLEAIFSSHPKNDLMQLYFNGGENPDFKFCNKYFRITDSDALKNIFKRNKDIGSVVIQQEVVSAPSGNLKKRRGFFPAKYTRNLLLMVRDLLWDMNNNLEAAKKWIALEKPDVIFYTGGDSIFSHKIVHRLSKHFNIPYCVYFTDDYIIYPQYFSFFDRLRISSLKNIYHKTIKNASLRFAIGDKMASEYSKYFHEEFFPVMNSVLIKEPYEFHPDSDNIVVSYFGGLHLGRDKMISRLGSILNNVSKLGNYTFRINVYAMQEPSQEILNEFKKNSVFFCGGVTGAEMEDKIINSDFLLHAESDLKYYKALTKLSVSTKIPEYLISGKPIIGFGPDDIASLELLKHNDIGVVISSYKTDKEIEDILQNHLKDDTKLKEIISRGYDFAVKKFNKTEVSNQLLNNIKSILNENTK